MLRQKLTRETNMMDMKIEEEKAPNKPQKSPQYLDNDPRAELNRYANSNYQVFETEPNDLLPDDQVFDLIGEDFDPKKDFEATKIKDFDPPPRRMTTAAGTSNSARVSFRTKRVLLGKKKSVDRKASGSNSSATATKTKFAGFKEKFKLLQNQK